jgi:hypothetical protein
MHHTIGKRNQQKQPKRLAAWIRANVPSKGSQFDFEVFLPLGDEIQNMVEDSRSLDLFLNGLFLGAPGKERVLGTVGNTGSHQYNEKH